MSKNWAEYDRGCPPNSSPKLLTESLCVMLYCRQGFLLELWTSFQALVLQQEQQLPATWTSTKWLSLVPQRCLSVVCVCVKGGFIVSLDSDSAYFGLLVLIFLLFICKHAEIFSSHCSEWKKLEPPFLTVLHLWFVVNHRWASLSKRLQLKAIWRGWLWSSEGRTPVSCLLTVTVSKPLFTRFWSYYQ